MLHNSYLLPFIWGVAGSQLPCLIKKYFWNISYNTVVNKSIVQNDVLLPFVVLKYWYSVLYKYFVILLVFSGVTNNWPYSTLNIRVFYTLRMIVKIYGYMQTYLKAVWIMRKHHSCCFRNMTKVHCLHHFQSAQQSLIFSFTCYNCIALLICIRLHCFTWQQNENCLCVLTNDTRQSVLCHTIYPLMTTPQIIFNRTKLPSEELFCGWATPPIDACQELLHIQSLIARPTWWRNKPHMIFYAIFLN